MKTVDQHTDGIQNEQQPEGCFFDLGDLSAEQALYRLRVACEASNISLRVIDITEHIIRATSGQDNAEVTHVLNTYNDTLPGEATTAQRIDCIQASVVAVDLFQLIVKGEHLTRTK